MTDFVRQMDSDKHRSKTFGGAHLTLGFPNATVRGHSLLVPIAMLLMSGLISVSAQSADSAKLEFFESRIRPLLVKNCHGCHSAKAKKLKAGLHLDSRQGFLSGGDSGPVITPGDAESGLLIRAVGYADVDLQMPPRGKLDDSELSDLKKWIADGAVWPEDGSSHQPAAKQQFDIAGRKASHWAWQPIGNPVAPQTKSLNWGQDNLDGFVLAKLETEKLTPGPAAEKRTLIRRLSFDLTGLPPTPDEIRNYLSDTSKEATGKVVTRLLDSPRFGERWARHWLDMVRYSETLGHEFDYTVHNAWRYRDYAIRAFNADVPFDQFMKEHVAGDLLSNPRRHPTEKFNESKIGTAFYWFGQQKHSPVDIRQETADTIDNQIDVLTRAFMGMTVACARCHDHKFDAISTKDYYSMFGVLGSSRYAQVAIDEEVTVAPLHGQLSKLREEIQHEAIRSISPELSRAAAYIKAAQDLPNHVQPASATATETKDILFEDFEGKLVGWKTTGDAFSGPQSQKTVGGYQGNMNAQGKGFINSHNIQRDGETIRSDRFTGTLTSPSFRITKPFIHFLVGGGQHKGKTGINLLIEGEIVRNVTGRAQNRMEPAQFDVRGLIGKHAQIQAVDLVTGGWGNIGLDHIVFGNDPVPGTAKPRPSISPAAVASYAKKHRLDSTTLERWLKALPELKQIKVTEIVTPPVGYEVFADFANGSERDWFREGLAWNKPSKVGDIIVSSTEGTSLSLLDKGWMHSAEIAPHFEGAFRSPTFDVNHDYVHVLVAGEDTRINAVVDSFTIIKNPIWGGLKKEVKKSAPHWLTFDLRMVRGHRAWLEFLDMPVGDPGAKGSYSKQGWMAVRQVLFSNESRAPGSLLSTKITSPEGAAIQVFSNEISEAIGSWEKRGQPSHRQLAVLNWLANADLLVSQRSALSTMLQRYRNLAAKVASPMRIPGMADGSGVDEFVFIRGNHRNHGAPAPRAFLDALSEQTRYQSTGSGRLELAQDLARPSNPLPARVFVNKVWHHLIGRGIVPSVDNFGVLGDRPSHPELLDHLAFWFQNNGWSTKNLIRKIVLSGTYQLSSKPANEVAEGQDPNNLLLHRANVKRLEGEAIRDAMLAISGSLDDEMYGAPVPVYLTSFMEGRGRPSTSGPLDGNGRRSIYIAIRRNFLSPMMLAFDTPPPATTVGRRPISNVPAQALIMMNDGLVAQQSLEWAETLAKKRPTEALIRSMYEEAFGRPPTATESAAAAQFLTSQETLHDGPEAKLQSRADLAHVLFNVKEFIFLN
jgi:hypothetical protein